MRRAKILCTIGPKNASSKILEGLLKNGMNIARLNMSHGTREWHTQTIKRIRTLEEQQKTPLPILIDVQGPRIRVGKLPTSGIRLIQGQSVCLLPIHPGDSGPTVTTNAVSPSIPIGYPALNEEVETGKKILIDDGLIELRVARVTQKGLECTVIVGGRVTSNKGVNFPDTSLSVPSLTDKDKEDIKFGIKNHVDYIALSFVRSAHDIRAVKQFLRKHGEQAIPIIAKIERPEAIKRLGKILDQADGVMIARGDLAIETALEAVPILQKQIIAEANRRHRLVITATQMLESMTKRSIPTRAEASDVANAVLDGSDILMLSAETSTGRYPIKAVQVMDRVIRSSESGAVLRWEPTNPTLDTHSSVALSACVAAASAAKLIQAKSIVVFTDSGKTALLMSKQRPHVPIIGLTPLPRSVKRMAAFWGLLGYLMPSIGSTDERIQMAEAILKRHQAVKQGDRIVILSGEHGQKVTGTNLIKIHDVT